MKTCKAAEYLKMGRSTLCRLAFHAAMRIIGTRK